MVTNFTQAKDRLLMEIQCSDDMYAAVDEDDFPSDNIGIVIKGLKTCDVLLTRNNLRYETHVQAIRPKYNKVLVLRHHDEHLCWIIEKATVAGVLEYLASKVLNHKGNSPTNNSHCLVPSKHGDYGEQTISREGGYSMQQLEEYGS